MPSERTSKPLAGLRAAWRESAWPDVAIAMLLFIGTLLLLRVYLFDAMPTLRGKVDYWSDEGTVLYNADRLRRGHVLYRDFFDFKGPVGFLPFAFGFSVAGPGVANGRLAMFVVIGLLTVATYAATRLVTERRVPSVAAALAVPLVAWPMWPFAYQDFTTQLFLLLGVVALLWQGSLTSRAAVAGVSCALAAWTTLSQGLPGAVALMVAIALFAYVTDGARGALRVGGSFFVALAATSGAVVGTFAAQGAGTALVRSVFVFPFRYYMSPINQIVYGADRQDYVDRWAKVGVLPGELVRIITAATVTLPWIALVVGGCAGGMLLGAALQAHRVPRRSPAEAKDLLRWTVPGALAAQMLPIIAGTTRSDLAHIGFVVPSAVVVTCMALGRLPAWWDGRTFPLLQRLGLAPLGVVVVAALGFYGFHVREPFVKRDLDVEAKRRLDVGYITALTREDDTIFSPRLGGYTYLLSGRDNATRYATLGFGEYYESQWPTAALEVREHRPKLLIANRRELDALVRFQPELRGRYVAVPGGYLLTEGAGPHPSLGKTFRIERSNLPSRPVLGNVEFGRVTPNVPRLSARLTEVGRPPQQVLAICHGNRLAVFAGGRAFVGTLAGDGRSWKGQMFHGRSSVGTFEARVVGD